MAAMLVCMAVLGVFFAVAGLAERYVPDKAWEKLARAMKFE